MATLIIIAALEVAILVAIFRDGARKGRLRRVYRRYRRLLGRREREAESIRQLNIYLKYKALKARRNEPSYRCSDCRAVSFNPNDVANRYCGNCHTLQMR